MSQVAKSAVHGLSLGLLLLVSLIWLASCSSTPSFPEPTPGMGQIVVELKGEAREGVSGPARRTVEDEYSTSSESVEKGKAFERVDYDAIEDVVVILEVPAGSRNTPMTPSVARQVVTDVGFERQQLLLWSGPDAATAPVLTLKNDTDRELTFFAFSDTDEYFETTVVGGADEKVKNLRAGRYEVMCEEDENISFILYVTDSPLGWIGPSDETPFFDRLSPGTYQIAVYAPRLPERLDVVGVASGKRDTVVAQLSVNELPKAE